MSFGGGDLTVGRALNDRYVRIRGDFHDGDHLSSDCDRRIYCGHTGARFPPHLVPDLVRRSAGAGVASRTRRPNVRHRCRSSYQATGRRVPLINSCGWGKLVRGGASGGIVYRSHRLTPCRLPAIRPVGTTRMAPARRAVANRGEMSTVLRGNLGGAPLVLDGVREQDRAPVGRGQTVR